MKKPLNPMKGEGSEALRLGGPQPLHTPKTPIAQFSSLVDRPSVGTRRKATGETSKDAASLTGPAAPAMRRAILAMLEGGAATSEMLLARFVATGIKTCISTVRGRNSDLRNAGLITDSGQRGRSETGRRCIAWRLTTATEREAFEQAKAEEKTAAVCEKCGAVLATEKAPEADMAEGGR